MILLDDASTDNSLDLLQAYANHPKASHFIVNDENSGGPFHQWKKGIDLARGEYIWIAESDDWAELNFLEEMVKMGSKEPASTVLYSRSYRSNEDGEVKRSNYLSTYELDDRRWKANFVNDGISECKNYLVHKNTIPNASAVIFKREVTQKIDWNFIDFKMAGDWFFWIKMLEHGDVSYTSSYLNYFRSSAQSTRNYSSIKDKLNISIEEIAILNYLKGKNITTFRKIAWRNTRLILKVIILVVLGIGSLPKGTYGKSMKILFNQF